MGSLFRASAVPIPQPPPAPPSRRDGRAGAGMGWRDTFSEGARYEWPRWSVAPGSVRAEWYLRAFRGGCDYGGSGQVLRAALWYHSVRLRHHRAVGARLHGVQFCVWVSAGIAIPGIPVPGLSVCALPGSRHPSPTPPRPPRVGGGGRGGSRAMEIGMCTDACSGFGWRWSMGSMHGCSLG